MNLLISSDGFVAYSSSEVRSLSLAIVVVAVSIFAMIAFAMSSLALFYTLAVIAIALGFFMAYYISKESKAVQAQPSERSTRSRRR